MKFAFNPIWSWPVVGIVIVALWVMVLLSYPKRIQHLPVGRRRFLIILRLLSAALLGFAMIRPVVTWNTGDAKPTRLYLLADVSRSMDIKDEPGSSTRLQGIVETVADSKPQFEQLVEENVETHFYEFSEEVQGVEQFSANAEGQQTAIGHALNELLPQIQPHPTVALILLSDGSQRTRSGFGSDPESVVSRYSELGIPIYTIGLGATAISEASLDLAMEEPLVDPLVFEKKTVAVRGRVRVMGAAGRPVVVRLLQEDRRGVQRGKSGELMPISPSSNTQTAITVTAKSNNEVIPFELSFAPQLPGEYKIAVEAVPLTGELKISNNSRETIVVVKRGGINILYVDSLRAERKWILSANTDEKIQVDTRTSLRGPLGAKSRISRRLFEQGRYNAYIIGDVSAKYFGNNVLGALKKRVDEGAGLLMIGGRQSFDAGGYGSTPLADVLPVELNPGAAQPVERIDPRQHYQRELKMMPTPEGERHYVMRLGPAEQNKQLWQTLPPLIDGNKLQKKNQFIEELATTPEGIPLLFAAEGGGARVMAFACDSTYLWYLSGHENLHQRFWRQVLLWLSRKEDDTDNAMWVNVDPKNFNPGQTVPIEFGARDEKGNPIGGVKYTINVQKPDGETRSFAAQPNGGSGLIEFDESTTPGDYWVNVTGEDADGKPLGFAAWTRFLVDTYDLELDNPAADHDLLTRISELTGGSFGKREQLPDFLERLATVAAQAEDVSNVEHISLWENWFFLGLFALVMSAEWYYRKHWGLV